MTKVLFPLFLILSFVSTAFSQEMIKVERVDFNKTKDDWIQMEVQLSCDDNTAPDARDSRYVEAIKVKVYLGYIHDASARQYDYYTSELEIVIMEKGDDNNVYFYLPGLIAERDQLPTDPEFYYAEISVKGTTQKPQKEAMSSNIPNLDILNKFISNATSSSDTEHLLTPIYYAPSEARERVSKLPTFLRRDVRQ
ncbi:MAG TPA: hypothetical protein DCX06_02865 [Opitutae bacterium]|nr:hypothetical protein [Opitutae bacterium]